MKVLIIGNTGLNDKNNSTNNRMKMIFKCLNKDYGWNFDYYKLNEATYQAGYINYLNKSADRRVLPALLFLLRRREKYDLVIAETFAASIIAFFLSVFKKEPFIWRQFGTTFYDELISKNRFNMRMNLKLVLHKVIARSKKCKAIVCTEDGCSNKALFINVIGLDNKKFFLVKNQRTENLSFSVDYVHKNNSDKFKLIQIGRITAWKKIDILIKAISELVKKHPEIRKNLELILVGIIQDARYENYLLKIIKENNLEENVFFEKNLQYHQIEVILAQMDLSISLTAYNPIIESLQNGVPIITYDYGEVSQIFNDCEAVFILAKDIKKSSLLTLAEKNQIQRELESKLFELYNKKKELKNIGIKGKTFVEKKFPTIEEHAKEVCDIYVNLV